MKILNLQQGSAEWLATRLSHFTASEAPIMMGASPYVSRDELLTYKTTQVEEEISNFQQMIYDQGHALEDMARPIAEDILGTELFPVTGSIDLGGHAFLASFDGLDMLHSVGFEHKQWNADKAAKMEELGEPLPEYVWQLEHQLMVSEAENILFLMSDGTRDNLIQFLYFSVPERREQLLRGWKQFAEDLDGYEPKEYQPAPEGESPDQLPSLSIQLIGEVKASNLAIYQKSAMKFIESISTELATDEDFASAEKTIKFCDKAEKELDLVKNQALSQTADISQLFNTVDTLKEAMRAKRLELNKLVKQRKEAIRVDIVQSRRAALQEHIDSLNSELAVVRLPEIPADFNAAIKGKKTIKSLEEAANDELASAKINATMIAQCYHDNLDVLDELAGDYKFLFNDLQAIVSKEPDDFELLVSSRVAQHKAEEEAKREAEAERIRQEERAKLESEQNAKAVSEEAPRVEPSESPKSEPSAEAPQEKELKVLASNELIDLRLYLHTVHGLSEEQVYRLSDAIVAGEVPHVLYTASRSQKAA